MDESGAVPAAAPEPLLAIRGLVKRYGAVEALKGVDIDLAAGGCVGLCGDNGAGKSTLIKIVSGAELPSAGTLAFEGRAVRFASPREALAAGIATIYQDLALAPRLSVAENLFMGAEPVRRLGGVLPVLDRRSMRARAEVLLAELGQAIPDVTLPVADLSGGQRQAVAISRALLHKARLVVMDEPTASLGVRETAEVLALVRRLKARGVTVLLVSHNMEDVVAVCDRVAILKGGRKALETRMDGLSADALAHMVMTGHALAA